jgi:sterol desaturase/sphingolipid hydroxylase (fatty acid hydroxylase superfamily)
LTARAWRAAGSIVVAGYLLAILKCNCGLLSVNEALREMLPWSAVSYFLVIPLAMMVAEAVFVGWRNSSLAAILRWTPSIKVDAFYLAGQIWLVPVLVLATTGGLYWHVTELTKEHSLRLAVIDDPVVQCLVVFVVADFVSYWTHRMMHASPALWEAHKVHHSATDLNLMVAFRFHPLESTILSLVTAAIFFVLGASVDTFVVFSFINMLLGQIQHARVDWTYGWLGWILVSPSYHRFHHSRHRADFDMNFGARLVLWDRLFGTYSSKAIRPDEIGVDDNTYVEKPLLAEFFRPYYALVVGASTAMRSVWRRRLAAKAGSEQAAD